MRRGGAGGVPDFANASRLLKVWSVGALMAFAVLVVFNGLWGYACPLGQTENRAGMHKSRGVAIPRSMGP
jgi:hypothetical protein